MQTTWLPGGDRRATAIAAASVAPLEVPAKMPSCVASARASRSASLPSTGTISSTSPAAMASSVSLETKSGLQPCIRCGRKCGWLALGVPSAARGWATPLASTGELSGSAATIRIAGSAALSPRATPSSVPPVPKPETKACTRSPSRSARISLAVVRVCTSAFASFSNWRGRYQPCAAASSIALLSIPVPFSDAGVSTTLAPRKRSSLRRSRLKLSAMTMTSG